MVYFVENETVNWSIFALFSPCLANLCIFVKRRECEISVEAKTLSIQKRKMDCLDLGQNEVYFNRQRQYTGITVHKLCIRYKCTLHTVLGTYN